jgi:hypothetical protein
MMNKELRRALLLIVLGGGYLLSRAWAQDGESKKEPPQPPTAALPRPDRPPDVFENRPWGVSEELGRHGRFGVRFPHPMSHEEMQEFESLHRAVEKLKTAKTDAEKTSATNEISQVLEKWFKRDLERREKQISEIETRVKKLLDQIEKRKKAKDEIINLRLKTIINEADGLGFPGAFEPESEGDPWSRNHYRAIVPPQAFDSGVVPSPFNAKAPPERAQSP